MFPDKCLGLRTEVVDKLTQIVPSAFRPLICRHLKKYIFTHARNPEEGIWKVQKRSGQIW